MDYEKEYNKICDKCIPRIRELEEENKTLKLTLEQMENTCKDYLNDRDTLREENRKLKEELDFFKEQAILWRNDYKNEYEENRKLKERIDILYEFIERNDKLVDEVIDEEDLYKLNRYIYIDDDLVDKALESED